MDVIDLLNDYLRISDIMYQALKASKYQIFDSMLGERGKVLEQIERLESEIKALPEDEKSSYWRRVEEVDDKIRVAMSDYKDELEKELAKVHEKKGKLRKQSNVKGYYPVATSGRGNYINKKR